MVVEHDEVERLCGCYGFGMSRPVVAAVQNGGKAQGLPGASVDWIGRARTRWLEVDVGFGGFA